MKTVKINLYKFEELSEEAKEKAIENNLDINTEFDWWQFIYEDALNVDLKINGFNCYRRSIDIDFIYNSKDTAESILKNHGEKTETYILAKKFLSEYEEAEKNEEKYSELYENIDPQNEEEEEQELNFSDLRDEAEEKMEDLSDEFLKELGEEYLQMLRNEYDYKTSEEAIKETLIINEYDFTENGEIY
jgi:hypothetical protein